MTTEKKPVLPDKEFMYRCVLEHNRLLDLGVVLPDGNVDDFALIRRLRQDKDRKP